ncbi:MAG TPA: Ni/Fe-hydrogenase cytochrome b subunit [Symbiobacteriaceae bacterium]|nr:Ni/Fe-hydrogenase cytochrome b subunit [Symbiobacteriaceae bacterium]
MSTARKILLALVGIGLGAVIYRFVYGLGAATNLSDKFPFGIWIAFDVMVGVPLAAGGFTIALVVYVLNLKRYRPLVRPAIVTAFIGYLLAASAIFVDIGQPQRIWHPIFFWNLHSPMFEVAACVITYLTVLALEFSPMFFESRRWERALRVVRGLMIPMVVLGIILSTMHQSSLGSLLLMTAGRLHPLWYTPWLPVFFLMSAVATGLAMVTVEAQISARAHGRGIEMPLLSSIAKGTWWVLAVLFAARMTDLWYGGRLGYVLEGSPESIMFLFEMALGFVVPLFLLAMKGIRRSADGLLFAQAFVLVGTIFNRFNSAMIGMASDLGGRYFPSVVELLVTVGFVATGALLYALAVDHLPVFVHAARDETGAHAAD